MTATQARVLKYLKNAPSFPVELYPVVSPDGTCSERGPSRGGPTKREYSVNNYMGKLQAKGWVRRHAYLDQDAPEHLKGKWSITVDGLRALINATRLGNTTK